MIAERDRELGLAGGKHGSGAQQRVRDDEKSNGHCDPKWN
jgi:hypothetical protein